MEAESGSPSQPVLGVTWGLPSAHPQGSDAAQGSGHVWEPLSLVCLQPCLFLARP